MPIIGEKDSVHAEYIIPKDIDKNIPEYFYIAMTGEIYSIFGKNIFDVIEVDPETNENVYNIDYCISTSGWVEAFKITCEKLHLQWLYDYWINLDWYDADIFDGIIEERIIHNIIETVSVPNNEYYKYLIQNK